MQDAKNKHDVIRPITIFLKACLFLVLPGFEKEIRAEPNFLI
jgi:hypothetical protein